MRELRTRWCDGAIQAHSDARDGRAVGRRRLLHRDAAHRRSMSADRLAVERGGVDVAQVDKHRQGIGLAGEIGHRLAGFDQHRADRAIEA